jgi:hypothetical protein
MRLTAILLLASGYSYAQCGGFEGFGDTLVCGADVPVQLGATPGFSNYSWTPAAGLSDPSIMDPVALVSTTTTYVVSAGGTATNIIPNPDFSLGNTGFISGLNYTPSYAPGNYYVADDWFGAPYGLTDHTPTSDNYFMCIDGIGSLSTLWETTVPVLPNTDYAFSFWASRTDQVTPDIEVHFIGNITGDAILSTFDVTLYSGTWTWDEYAPPVWNSGSNTSLTIRLINLELDGYGNDFGLDDITLMENCFVQDTVVVSVGASPAVLPDLDFTICKGDTIPDPQVYSPDFWWYTSFPGTGSQTTPAFMTAGDFTFYVTGQNGACESQPAVVHVQVIDPPDFDLEDSYTFCVDETALIGPQNPDWNYTWHDGTFTSPRPVTTGSYVLTATNACGLLTDSTHVYVEDCDCFFYLPNAITVDGNGENEVFVPVYDCDLQNYRLLIFDRWGEVVFETDNPLQAWNAMNGSGIFVQDGVYVWDVIFEETETELFKTFTGHVTVLK